MTLTLQDLLRGRGAHVDPVATVEGTDWILAGRHIPGIEHTIWQLVVHMNYWMDYELEAIEGEEHPYPAHAAESWPTEDAATGSDRWATEVGRFRTGVERLVALAGTVAGQPAGGRIVHTKGLETVETVLWQMAAHNSYHIGQVVQLRRALDAWPPPDGGDTW